MTAMIQLIAAIALMYMVVGTAGYWAVKKQRMLKQLELPGSGAGHQHRNGQGERHG